MAPYYTISPILIFSPPRSLHSPTVPAEPGMDTVSVYFTVTIRIKLDIKNFSDSFTATNLLNYEQYNNDFNK